MDKNENILNVRNNFSNFRWVYKVKKILNIEKQNLKLVNFLLTAINIFNNGLIKLKIDSEIIGKHILTGN